jgi:hypothetical protein
MAGINNYPGFLSDIVQGDTKDFRIAITLEGVAVDITGSTFYLTLDVDKVIATAPELEVTITSLSDPTNGITTGTITDTETAALTAGTMYYSLRYVTAAGKTYVLDMGEITVLPGVSSRIA